MTTTLEISAAAAWVAARRDRVSFAVELATTDTPAHDRGRHLVESGKLAEELGFDAVLLPDHPTFMPDCWTYLAALATTTTRIRLGTNVACALYRHPVMLARLGSDLDHLSRGRVVLGLGAGWSEPEFTRLGLTLRSARARQAALEDTVNILDGVWRPAAFSYQGAEFSIPKTRIDPPPIQSPRPPILIAGGGERVTLRQVARYGDACQLSDIGILHGASDVDGIRHKLVLLRDYCDEVGRDYTQILRTHFTGWLILARDAAGVRRKLERYAPGGLAQRYSGAWTGYAVACTPAEAVEYYQHLVQAGIQYFVVQTMDASDTETLRLLAEAVVPRITEAHASASATV